jgi:predicted nucleic acid-binding protein
VLALALSDSIQLCVSGSVYAEYEEVLRRPRLQRRENVIAGALDTIREKGFWVRPSERHSSQYSGQGQAVERRAAGDR